MMTLGVFAPACSRESAESDLLGDAADTFLNLRPRTCAGAAGPAGQSQGGLRHLAVLELAEVVAGVEALTRPRLLGPMTIRFDATFDSHPNSWFH
jgi:hypothetical protein